MEETQSNIHRGNMAEEKPAVGAVPMTTLNISNMSVVELKALAYDQLAMIENCQKNLAALNQEIVKKSPQAAQSVNP